MATKKLTFNIALEQNKNMESTAYGKYFGKTYSPNEALNLKGLIQRVAMDQSVFSEDIARGVIDRLTVTMVELLQSGTSVKWDQLGTFRPTVESVGVSDPLDYNVNTDVKGIHIRFIPENAKGEEITSRQFADLCTMMTVGIWTVEKVTISGKEKSVRRFRPMASFKDQGSHAEIPAVTPTLVQLFAKGSKILTPINGKFHSSLADFAAGQAIVSGFPNPDEKTQPGILNCDYFLSVGDPANGGILLDDQEVSLVTAKVNTSKMRFTWTGKSLTAGEYPLNMQWTNAEGETANKTIGTIVLS